jgi:hypothetical protein
MKKLTIIILLTAIQIFSIIFEIKAQNPNDFYNSLIPYSNFYNTRVDPFRGYFKPNTTEWNGPNPSDSEAYFPILVVFVQFADDPVYAPFGSWPIGEAPVYINVMIAIEKNKNQNTPWWDKYNPETEALSSQWMEISRGKLHVISPHFDIIGNDTIKGAFSVLLDSAYKYTAEQQMNQAIWMDLHRQGLTDWTPYDKWRYNNQDGRFYYEKDSIVDFIYKIHRSRGRGPMPSYDGFSALTSSGAGSCLVDTVHSIIADYSWGINGSGFTVSFRGLKSQYIGCTGHEHGHYMMMPGHVQNSRVSYGIGFEGFFSPYDMI